MISIFLDKDLICDLEALARASGKDFLALVESILREVVEDDKAAHAALTEGETA